MHNLDASPWRSLAAPQPNAHTRPFPISRRVIAVSIVFTGQASARRSSGIAEERFRHHDCQRQ
jgi:hypothetical protein